MSQLTVSVINQGPFMCNLVVLGLCRSPNAALQKEFPFPTSYRSSIYFCGPPFKILQTTLLKRLLVEDVEERLLGEDVVLPTSKRGCILEKRSCEKEAQKIKVKMWFFVRANMDASLRREIVKKRHNRSRRKNMWKDRESKKSECGV